ncbi:beta-ketoacyl-ACP synthase 3 [Streptomyces sp. NPDC056056]|uniref:beta-ketoacyl-ACP synthase 3 n=1 Tax=Streptomyces sp. NPDC056056 TaxID=3345698 RepID=UPI0035E177A1
MTRRPHLAVPAVLCGVGTALPDRTVSNQQVGGHLGLSADWITQRTGISNRLRCGPDTSTADLAVGAGAAALESSGGHPVEAVIVATATPDHLMPATAPTVAARLGLRGIAAFDVAAACTGLLYALQVAQGLICTGSAQRVLVIAADRLSHTTDPDDPATAPLFGDGAAAVILRNGQADEPGVLGPIVLGADGQHADALFIPHGQFMRMRGREVFQHAITRLVQVSAQAASATGWSPRDVDRFVPHQANARITAAVAQRLGVARHRVLESIGDLGNTSVASIPITLARSAADGSLREGHRVLLSAFGAGLTWGATTLVWPRLECVAGYPNTPGRLEATR